MKPSNQYTTPEQRFFLPDKLEEGEYHFSVDMTDVPNAHLLPGEFGYSVVKAPDGETKAYLSGVSKNIPSGSVVKSVLTTGVPRDASKYYQEEVLSPDTDEADREKLKVPAEVLELQQGDVLILSVNTIGLPKDSYVAQETDRDGVMLWPSDRPLPYSDDPDGDDDFQEVTYDLMGVVHNQDLVSWKSNNGIHLRHVVDLAVANELADNPLERAVVAHQLRINHSLLSLLRTNEAAGAYLKHFDRLHGTSFMPDKDPDPVYKHKEQMTPRQLVRYNTIVDFIAGLRKSL